MKNRIKYRNKCVLYIQRIVRGFLARKQHQPRYRGIIQIKSLKEKLHRSTDIVNQVKGGKDMILKQSNDIEHLMNGYVKNIQNDSRIPAKTIDKMYNDIMTKIDNFNNMIQTELKVTINKQQKSSIAIHPIFNRILDLVSDPETTSSWRARAITQNSRGSRARTPTKGRGRA